MSVNEKKIKMRLAVLVVFLSVLFGGCVVRKQEPAANPSESFTKIYDKADNSTYTAVDIKQTEDEGYIILGMVNQVPYLLKIDNRGDVIWDTLAEDYSEYRQPVKNLLIIKGDYYFFCNKKEEKQGAGLRDIVLLKVEQDKKPGQQDFLNYIIDRAGNCSDGDCEVCDICKNDDCEACESCEDCDDIWALFLDTHALRPLHAININSSNRVLALFFSVKYDKIMLLEIDEDYKIRPLIIPIKYKCAYSNPFLDRRKHFVGHVGLEETDAFHYFQSYSLFNNDSQWPCFSISRKVLPDDSNATLTNPDEIPISNPFIAVEWDGSYSFKALIIDNIVCFSEHQDVSEVDEQDIHDQPELIDTKPVFIKMMMVKGQKVVFFLGSAKNNKIVLYAYTDEPGKGLLRDRFKNKLYFGNTHIFEAEGLIETKDNGLAILGTTYVAGQLGRLCVFKLSKEKLEKLLSTQNNS